MDSLAFATEKKSARVQLNSGTEPSSFAATVSLFRATCWGKKSEELLCLISGESLALRARLGTRHSALAARGHFSLPKYDEQTE